MSKKNIPHVKQLGSGDYSASQFGEIVTVHASGIRASGAHATATLSQNPNYTDRPTFYLYIDEIHPELANLLLLSTSVTLISKDVVTEVAIFDAQTGLPDSPNVSPTIVPVKLLKGGDTQA